MNPRPAPRGPRRWPGPLLVLAVAAVALAACSSTPSASHTGTSSAPRSTTTSAPGSTTASSSTTSSTASTSTSSPPAEAACSTGILQVTPSGSATSAGTAHLTFTVKNGGPRPCSLAGYPAVSLYATSAAGGAGAGARLPISDVHLGGPPSPITLAAGSSAQFVLSVSDVPVNGGGCSTVGSLEVTPPGSKESLSVPDSFQACGTSVGVGPVATAS